MMSDELEAIAIPPENLSILRSAQSCGALDHGVEYPLHVARRSGDNLQKLADRGVLLQRFRQALLKQPGSARPYTTSRRQLGVLRCWPLQVLRLVPSVPLPPPAKIIGAKPITAAEASSPARAMGPKPPILSTSAV